MNCKVGISQYTLLVWPDTTGGYCLLVMAFHGLFPQNNNQWLRFDSDTVLCHVRALTWHRYASSRKMTGNYSQQLATPDHPAHTMLVSPLHCRAQSICRIWRNVAKPSVAPLCMPDRWRGEASTRGCCPSPKDSQVEIKTKKSQSRMSMKSMQYIPCRS